MSQPYHFQVSPGMAGERLDKILVAQLGSQITRSQLQALIRDGHVRVNDQPARPGWRLKGGETIALAMPPPAQSAAMQPEPIALEIFYEDEWLAVINKPAGMVVHPGAGGETGTLVHALLARYPEIAQMRLNPKRRGIVHRLDKDTSGLLVVARTEPVLQALMQQFSRRTVEKRYLALLERRPPSRTGRITAPIARDPANRKKMAVQRDGRPAITEFFVEREYEGGFTLVRVHLLTGRTHQIRVHMAFVGAPIVGDRLYGQRRQRLPLRRQFLHACSLAFSHPVSGEPLAFEAPLPADMQQVLDMLTPAV